MKLCRYLIIAVVFGAGAVLAAEASDFTVKPYLLDIGTDSAVVGFHLPEALDAKVIVEKAGGEAEFKSEKSGTSHFIKVTGLESGSSYKYRVVCGDGKIQTGEDEGYEIRTAVRRGESFSFAVYGDTRPGDNKTSWHHKEVIEQARMHEPLFCLVLGDMVDDGGDRRQWQEFFDVESGLLRRSAIYPVWGDTEIAAGRGIYGEYFPNVTKGYYRFEAGGVQFFALNAWGTKGGQDRSEFDEQSEQLKWFVSELEKPEVQAAPFRVVFLHDPVCISRGRASEVLERVWAPVFAKYKVDAVFASWHLYERSAKDDVTYIISGGAGAELIWLEKNPAYRSQAEARQYHFCRVDITSDTMTINAIAPDGTVIDSIMLSPKNAGAVNAEQTAGAAKRLGREIVIRPSGKSEEVTMNLFSSDCAYCRKLLKYELPRLAEEKNVAIRVNYFDMGIKGAYELFLAAGAEFGRQGSDVPAIFIGRTVLGGESEIKKQLPEQLAMFAKDPQKFSASAIKPFSQGQAANGKEQKFGMLNFWIVCGAGLLDGINPCAFTTVIFLISYLGLVGGTRRQMLLTGAMFTAAVFIAYFATGIAFFGIVRIIMRQHVLAIVVNSILLCGLMMLAVLSFIDFIKCRRGQVSDVTLQLPGWIKLKIHEKIRNFARNSAAAAGAAFVLGIVVAGMELTCTGQVYFPIVTMISEPEHRLRAVGYLGVYNVAFILPLAAVFLAACMGVTSERMGKLFRRHVAGIKLLLAVLFAAMAAMVVMSLRLLT